jgi:hypothetical protein
MGIDEFSPSERLTQPDDERRLDRDTRRAQSATSADADDRSADDRARDRSSVSTVRYRISATVTPEHELPLVRPVRSLG